MTAEAVLGAPTLYALVRAGAYEVLPDLPDEYHFVVGAGRQVPAVGRELDCVDIAGMALYTIAELHQFFLRLVDLPNFGEAVDVGSFLGVVLVGAACGEFISEGVEVQRQNALFFSMPKDHRQLDVHLAAMGKFKL